MPAHELSQGVDHDISAMLDRPQKDGRRNGVVYNQRQPAQMRHFGEGLDVTNVACGIAYGFAKDRTRRLIDQAGDIRGPLARRETRLDPMRF